MLTSLDEFNRPSLGTELIQRLHDESKVEDKVSIISPPIVEEKVPEVIPEPIKEPLVNQYAGFIQNGVEVVDVKNPQQREKLKLDKFGIPVQPGEHANFDRI